MAEIAGWVLADFGIEVTGAERVHAGADLAAEVWRVTARDGSRYAVKWSGTGTGAGLPAAEFLATAGISGVPGPLRTRRDELWAVRDGRRLSVVPWIDGPQAAETGLTG